jgi:dolichol-phosphate mannosyltransferase
LNPEVSAQLGALPPFTIVVAALNEEETIETVLRGLVGMTDDLLVVDGHSTDRTADIARSCGAKVLLDHGLGKGDAVRVAIEAARNPITVFFDADGSHDPRDIPKLVAPIASGKADLVMGSRMLGGSDELFGAVPEILRMLGSVVISNLINYRFGVRFTDYQNGLRAIRTSVARDLELSSDRTTIEQEMAMRCLARGYRVTEVPTHEYRRAAGKSKINVFRVAHIYLWNLLKGLVQRRRAGPASSAGRD